MALRVCFFHSDKPRERILSDAFCRGVSEHGDYVEQRPLTPDIQLADADVVCMVGVKSRELYRAHFQAGQHVIMIDKGYSRHAAPGPVKLWEYWRFAVNGHHPTQHLMRIERPADRVDSLGLVIPAWRKSGSHIVLAGSSQKYHDFYGLKEPTAWAQKLVRNLRQFTNREIVYRPKPSWRDAVPIEGTRFSSGEETIHDVLKDAHCLITHGSNACFEAVLSGIPSVILGDAVAKPISTTSFEEIENPKLATYRERHQWLANLAYFQWTMAEMGEGKAWAALRPYIFG